MDNNVKGVVMVVVGVVIALIIGLVGGYYYGNTGGYSNGYEDGVVAGRQAILDEQAKEEQQRLDTLQKAANPFSESDGDAANPFKDTYSNPFAQ